MRGRRWLYWISILVCGTGMLLCAGMLIRQGHEYRVGEQAYDTLEETVLVQPSEAPGSESAPAQTDQASQETLPEVDFETLTSMNSDIVGWLYGPDTVISYPVLQGEDNTYYLNHLFDGTRNGAGSLFLDSRCSGFEGKNSVIYGHYMKNGTLFASLEAYQDQAYYEAHPCLFLITPDRILTIQLFSAYIAGPEEEAWQLTFSSGEDFQTWLEVLRERSCFESSCVPQVTDQVVTLSTCNYTFPNARFVCHGLVLEQ